MANPFDQFAVDLQASLPQAGAPYGETIAPPPPFGAPPLPTGGPPQLMMNAPPQTQYGYGAPPPPYGQPLQQPPAQPTYEQNPFGGMGGTPQAPPMAPPVPEPAAILSSDAFGGGYAQPPVPSGPPQAPEAYGPPPVPDASANPFGAMTDPSIPHPAPAYDAPAAAGGQFADPWGSTGNAPAPVHAPPPMQTGYAPVPLPIVAPTMDATPPPFGAAAAVAPPPPQPYGMDPSAPPPQDYGVGGGALVVSEQQVNPYAQPAQPPNPYGNPYGQLQQQPPQQQQQYVGYAPQPPPPPPPVDPFSVFESAPAPAAFETAMVPAAPSALAVTSTAPAVSDDEFWGSFAPNAKEEAPVVKEKEVVENVEEEKKGEDGLPPGGEWYDARIFTPTLGVMFFKPQELTDSLFLNTDKSIVDALGERPVVAFIVEGSSARSAGVELGHVLLKVNGVDVKNPKEASRLIKEGPRPLPLLFYVPTTDVVVAEGEHMVKYDTKETTAPNSAKDWKPKYVVIGGIISQPWMMNMYRSKSEYDIAVIETQARRPVSVKVKQFSLQGARIQNDWQGPQMVKYKNKLHPWKYIVVLPVARNPIKISSPNLAQLKPVHEGIRRVLLAQQRGRGAPSRDRESYANHGRDQNSSRSEQSYDRRSSERSSYDDRASSGRDSYERDSYGGGSNSYGPPVGAGDPYGGGYTQPQPAYRY